MKWLTSHDILLLRGDILRYSMQSSERPRESADFSPLRETLAPRWHIETIPHPHELANAELDQLEAVRGGDFDTFYLTHVLADGDTNDALLTPEVLDDVQLLEISRKPNQRAIIVGRVALNMLLAPGYQLLRVHTDPAYTLNVPFVINQLQTRHNVPIKAHDNGAFSVLEYRHDVSRTSLLGTWEPLTIRGQVGSRS